MKCPICGKDVELKKKKIHVDEQGNPVFHQFAICKDCKKQWDLDKQRAKKAAKDTTEKKVSVQKPESEKMTSEKKIKKAAEAPVKAESDKVQASTKKAPVKKAAPAKAEADKPQAPAKKAPVKKTASAKTEADKAQAPTKKAPVKAETDKAQASAKKAPVKKAAPTKTEADKPQAPVKKATSAKTEADKAQAPVKKVPVKKAVSAKTEADKAQAPAKKTPVKKAVPAKTEADKAQAPAKKAASPKKKATTASSASKKASTVGGTTKKVDNKVISMDEERYLGNVPPEKVRSKRARVVKQGYEEMLAADPKSKKTKKKDSADVSGKHAVSKPVKSEPDVYEEDFKSVPRFRALRIIFGILSILIGAFYAYNSLSAGLMETATGLTFLILAGCMALAGLLLIILNGTNNILAFLLPMILYLGSGVYAFLNRADETFLLYGAIIGAAFSVLFIILAISSRGDEEDYENFDDDDDFDDDDWDDDDN